jgi:hypothetical protein
MQSKRSNSLAIKATTLTGAVLISLGVTSSVFACPMADKINGVLKGPGNTPSEPITKPIDMTKAGLVGGGLAAIAGLIVAKKVSAQRLAKAQPTVDATPEIDYVSAAAFSIPIPAEALSQELSASESEILLSDAHL